MIFYQLDYVVDEIKKAELSVEQRKLKYYTGANFSKKEASRVWERVLDHKWYVGERLKRDVGLRVAAIDFIENFYEPESNFKDKNSRKTLFGKVSRPFSQILRSYFVAKSYNISSL